jgi:hypothetical protein
MRLPLQSPPVQRDLLMSASYWKGGGIEAATDPSALLSGIGQEIRNEINSIFTAVRLELPSGWGYRPIVSSSHNCIAGRTGFLTARNRQFRDYKAREESDR